MRCRRCHSVIDPNKKMCPVCGTLIRKPRGTIRLSRQAGGTAMDAIVAGTNRLLGGTDPKIFLAVLCGVILAGAAVFSFGCVDCDSCDTSDARGMVSQTCRSCSDSCTSSCDACSSTFEGLTSCDGPHFSCGGTSDSDASPSDASSSDVSSSDKSAPTAPAVEKAPNVAAHKHGASCAGCGSNADEIVYEPSVNSTPLGREVLCGDTLYYAASSGIYYLCANDETGLLVAGKGIGSLYLDGDMLYYLMSGDLWRVPVKGGESALVVDATSEASDTAVTHINGYGVSDGRVCWWGPDSNEDLLICSRALDGGEGSDDKDGNKNGNKDGNKDYNKECLHRGSCAQQQVYRGGVYYLSREDDDFNTLYRLPLDGGRAQEMLSVPVAYFTLCDGSVFAYTWIDSEAALYRVNCDSLDVENSWRFIAIRGLAANDSEVYYYCNDADGTGSVFCMAPDGTGNRKVFADSSVIQLGHISGSYVSLYTNIDENAENRLAGAKYIILDPSTGSKMRVY